MTDAVEIANLKARYCAASDRSAHDPTGAVAELIGYFVPEATADYGFVQFDSPDKLAGFMATAIGGGSEWMIHALGSPRIEVAGDTATGDWTITVHSKRRDGEQMQVVGRYSDRFVRTPDGWRIAHVGFTRYE
ncbi:nuclear transport factor 2 family protein [Novosphingobium piscinae]|uniref:Nuclear transport factor 2 family protein n=1 Tax=Novosphingobium piscinae TaxID=1507448 RepID=A0A7X1FVI4_9SPHN|nr:nuclear transport factor 2 family protein [Novosphingobium piscinae]MBC2667726.1 nuclear transport factor 2 family protein [Novosphingobium piscinae]